MMKLIEKKRVGSKIKKIYDKPKTPYHRLLDCEHVGRSMKRQLEDRYKAFNPFDLKRRMETKMGDYHRLVRIAKQNEVKNDPAA